MATVQASRTSETETRRAGGLSEWHLHGDFFLVSDDTKRDDLARVRPEHSALQIPRIVNCSAVDGCDDITCGQPGFCGGRVFADARDENAHLHAEVLR